MGLKEELMNDFKQSMKAHDEVAKNTISLARAAIKQYEVDKREELDDEGILVIFFTFLSPWSPLIFRYLCHRWYCCS